MDVVKDSGRRPISLSEEVSEPILSDSSTTARRHQRKKGRRLKRVGPICGSRYALHFFFSFLRGHPTHLNAMSYSSNTTSSSSCSSPSRLPTLIFFLFISIALALVNIPTVIGETAFYSCSRSEFRTDGIYGRNVLSLLRQLKNETAAAGFSNLTVGRPPNTIYGYALCRGDRTPAQCQSCLDMAVEDTQRQCPSRWWAALWYDYCRIRYSNEPFFSSLTANAKPPYLYKYDIVPDRDLFKLRIGKLLRNLHDRAMDAENPRFFAAGSINYTANLGLYGMVQCTRDLSAADCSKCLTPPIKKALCCTESVDSTFLGGSCYLRYSTELFYNSSATATVTIPHASTAGERPSTAKKGIGKTVIFIIAIICGVGILLILLGIILRKRIRRKPKSVKLGTATRNLHLQENGGLTFHRLTSKKRSLFHSQNSFDASVHDTVKLDLQTMKIATENFSEFRRLGRGTFGPSFKGDIHGREFVIKRLSGIPRVGPEELKKEFRSLKQIQHPNIARLLACHVEEEDRLLVYEYLPNTSLDKILFDPKKRVLLDWGRRYKIIEGIARGLLQLHEATGLNIVHQNLKASNVLLDKNMNPKLSDFCLPKLFIGKQSHGSRRRTAVAQGYTENIVNGSFTAKTDIFSYGVLVLEIVTGQRNRDFFGSESTINLLSYVWQYWRDEKALQVLDWSLGEMYKGHEVLRCIHVGLLCVQEDADRRPNMSTVVKMLNSYSFTLPSPSVPSVTRVRKPSNLSRSEGSGSWDWKTLNEDLVQLSPRSPNEWSDVSLDSRGRNCK